MRFKRLNFGVKYLSEMGPEQEIAELRRQLEQEKAARLAAEELAESHFEVIEAFTQRNSFSIFQNETYTDSTLLIRCTYEGTIHYVGASGQKLVNSLPKNRKLALERFISSRIHAAATKAKTSFEARLNGKNYSVHILPMPEKGYYSIYASDITNHSKAELTLQEIRKFVRDVAHTIPNIIYIYDIQERKSIYINEHLKSVLGYADTDIATFSRHVLKTLVSQEDTLKLYKHVQQIQQAEDGDVLQVEYQVRCKDGTVKNIFCRESVFKRSDNGQVKQIIGSAEDVTALRKKSMELERQKDFYESILNHIPSDIAVYNNKRQYVFLNPVAVKDPELRKWIIGKTNKEYSAYRGVPYERMKVREAHLDYAFEQKKLVEFEETTIDKKGNEQHHLRRLNPVLDKENEVQLLIGHGLNITDLRKAQNEIAASEAKNRAILAAIPDLMFILSKDGYYMDMKNADELNLLVALDSIIGSHISSVVSEKLADEVMEIVQRVLETGQHEKMEYALDFESGVHYFEGRLIKYNENEVLAIIRDTTEERNAAFEVKEKNEFIRHVIDTSPSLIFVKNAAGEFSLANSESAKLFGSTVGQMIGTNAYSLYNNKEEATFYNNIDQKVIQEGREIKLEEKFTRADGEVIWLNTIKKPIVTTNGEVQVLSIATSITEQRIAKQRLQESEELFRLLSENSKDLISLHEPNGRYIYISKACKELLGYEPEELIGSMPMEIVHPDDLDLIAQKGNPTYLLEHANVSLQHRFIRKDGTTQWVETNIKPILDAAGNVLKIQSAARDITERKTAEEALKTSEKKYRDLIKYSRAYFCTHNMQGLFQEVNPHMLDMLGYTSEEMVGHNLKSFIPQKHHDNISTYLEEFKSKNLVEGVFTILNKENKERFLFYKNYKVEEADTEPYIICIAQDITDRMHAERELKIAKEAAEESARVKENFLANMSHEIRTPMNGIMGMAGLLKKSPLNSTQQNYIEIIQQSADNLLVIINDILDIAKIEAGRLELEEIPFKICETIQAAYQTLSYKAEEKEIEYRIEPLVLEHNVFIGDPYRLNQVLLNLLNNAIKFTEVGSVTLSSKVLEETEAMVKLEFAVSDTGIGVPSDKTEYIFEGFSQAYSSTTRKYGGTGLGLNICRNLVEMQGGRIWVESEENKGSTFKFELSYPKYKNDDFDNQEKQAIDFNGLSGTRVLLAEDNEVNIFLAQSIMEAWNFEVDVARNGLEAVELASQKNYDVILMDIQMPEMSGLDATKRIRSSRDEQKARVPIIALTANALKGDAEKYLSIGMNAYISKPFEEEQLYITIANALPHKSITKEDIALDSVPLEPESAPEPLYDLSMLYRISRGNEAFIKRTKSLILETVPETLTDLNTKKQQQDWPGVSAAAHKLKSTIDTLRIEKLQEVVRKIETEAKTEGSYDDVKVNIAYLNEVMEKVLKQMKAEV